jgi:hypothetical protein
MSDEEREYLNETIRSLNSQLVDALRERDEARREVCLTWESVMGRKAQTVAEDRGWDCFKENTNG